MKRTLAFALSVLIVFITVSALTCSVSANTVYSISNSRVYRLKNSYSNTYLQQSTPSLSAVGAAVAAIQGQPASYQLFRVISATDEYKNIMLMSTSSGTFENNLALSYNNSNGYGPMFSYCVPVSYSFCWSFTLLANGTFTIRSAVGDSSTNYLTVSTSGTITVTSYSGTRSQWTLEDFTSNMYFGGSYNFNGSPQNAYATASSDVHAAYGSSVLSCVNAWNNYSSAVDITYIPMGTGYGGKNEMILIMFEDEDFFPDNVLAMVCPVIAYTIYNDPSSAMINADWQYAVIYINNSFITSSGIQNDELKAIIRHETGHCLKISHPTSPNEYFTYPSLMASIMNTYSGDTIVDALNHISSYKLTNFDKEALIAKWGQ